MSNASHYNAGRNVGDVVSIIVGAAEALIGGTEAVAGTGGTVVTAETTKTIQSPGKDGATSKHIIETESKGNTVSKTHKVTDQKGNTIHQHQDFVPQNLLKGEKANTRQFPDEWVKYPNINTK
ncbi:hypothetical protein JCM10512_5059 [Bacteroides reticulotermitis JCM 10512]|uniref:Uncharacterized protein n=1 Tax=Bacteroides reticulotermitis JCM 10512 TaxID=1445607 RepID=W4UZ60_9BACE|nr:hypothetical protein JCM10512_5059 [Bacteroides reticulotermitis JCM 10512]